MNKITSKKKLETRSRGFTLVETLIAVTVLMIAIAGPLVVASKGLTAVLISRDQMTASLLAQETMETIKNTRDNNIQDGDDWDEYLDQCVRPDEDDTLKCDFLPFDPPGSNLATDCDTSALGCRLYRTDNGYESTESLNQESIFYRYFYLNVRGGNSDDYTATVVVSWYHGTVQNEVRLVSELTSGVRL